MLKKVLALLSIFIIVFSLSVTSFAHSGGTDSKGGHYNGSSYHYHHGYPAHQHTNGHCPYDFDDKTNYNSSSSSKTNFNNSKDYSGIVLGLTFVSWAPISWSYIHYKENKNAFRFWFSLLILCMVALIYFISKNPSLITIPLYTYLGLGSLIGFCCLCPKKPRLAAAIAIVVIVLMIIYS